MYLPRGCYAGLRDVRGKDVGRKGIVGEKRAEIHGRSGFSATESRLSDTRALIFFLETRRWVIFSTGKTLFSSKRRNISREIIYLPLFFFSASCKLLDFLEIIRIYINFSILFVADVILSVDYNRISVECYPENLTRGRK